jgi:hypothetical protein
MLTDPHAAAGASRFRRNRRVQSGAAAKQAAEERQRKAQAQHEVQRGLLLDVVVRERAAVLELLARKDESLLVRGNACTEQSGDNMTHCKTWLQVERVGW